MCCLLNIEKRKDSTESSTWALSNFLREVNQSKENTSASTNCKGELLLYCADIKSFAGDVPLICCVLHVLGDGVACALMLHFRQHMNVRINRVLCFRAVLNNVLQMTRSSSRHHLDVV